jgi:hypothetical protein
VRVATHQPCLFPWAGFWHKLASVDMLGLLTDVQFDASSNQHRCMLGNSWLTVPVAKEDRHKQYRDVRVADGWTSLDMVRTIYGRMPRKQYPYLDRLTPMLNFLQYGRTRFLWEIVYFAMCETASLLEVKTPFAAIPPAPYVGETKNDRLWEHVARIQEYPGTYVCGSGTASYIDPQKTHGWSVDIQKEVDETVPDRFQSVLSFIGREADPLGAMMQRFTLEPLVGGGDGSVLQAGHTSGGCQSSS